ncbi:unnamed protein product [Ilex paraguariensis]|uniref:Uncharacterized protein n=1 Tax=Ilex paraguariensis TaxID=185542 RepID=A0ABC8U7D6_9AQUA
MGSRLMLYSRQMHVHTSGITLRLLKTLAFLFGAVSKYLSLFFHIKANTTVFVLEEEDEFQTQVLSPVRVLPCWFFDNLEISLVSMCLSMHTNNGKIRHLFLFSNAVISLIQKRKKTALLFKINDFNR